MTRNEVLDANISEEDESGLRPSSFDEYVGQTSLKENLKIETITSSNDIIIYQDIYSQMLVYNLIQAFKQDAEKNIDQTKYKNEMKVNMNMAVGFVKKALIKIILEEDINKQNQMFDLLEQKIEKYIIPIKKDRHYPRNKGKKNKYSINKRKSF